MYNQSKKKRNILNFSNTNYHKEIKLIPINVDYCLLQFDAVKFFLGVLYVCVCGGGFLLETYFSIAEQYILFSLYLVKCKCVKTRFKDFPL